MKEINKSYCKPEIEIVNLEQNDIIVTSWNGEWDLELENIEE